MYAAIYHASYMYAAIQRALQTLQHAHTYIQAVHRTASSHTHITRTIHIINFSYLNTLRTLRAVHCLGIYWVLGTYVTVSSQQCRIRIAVVVPSA